MYKPASFNAQTAVKIRKKSQRKLHVTGNMFVAEIFVEMPTRNRKKTYHVNYMALTKVKYCTKS